MRFRWEFVAGAALLGLAVILALTDAGKGSLGTGWAEPAAEPVADLPDPPPFGAPTVTPDTLAASLMAGEPGLTVVDIRPGDAAPADRIPGSYWLPLDDPSWQPPGPFGEHRRLVLVTDAGLSDDGYWSLFAGVGHHDNFAVLAGGIDAWNERFTDPQEPAEDADATTWEHYEARRAVSLFLAGGVAALTDGAAGDGAIRPAAPPPPPLPVRQASSAPKPAEGC
jgi:rhodanese-related sulfurtransferase